MSEYSTEYQSDRTKTSIQTTSNMLQTERKLRIMLKSHLEKEIDGIIFYMRYVFPFIRKEKNGSVLGSDMWNSIRFMLADVD